MKVMFLDESGDHSLEKIDDQFPIFCLAGCIFDESEYQNDCNQKIDEFKVRYLKRKDVVLHSREIRKCEPPFNILLNPKTKRAFYDDLDNLMSTMPYTILASGIRKKKLKAQYSDPTNPYMLSIQFLLERFLFFLDESNDVGYISVESRDPKSNTDLLNAFTDIINNGSGGNELHITAARFQRKIQQMIFVTKQQNHNGHQIADLIAYPIAKHVLNSVAANAAFDVLKPKFRNRGGKIEGCGLKIFP